jgi:hypothetical protein
LWNAEFLYEDSLINKKFIAGPRKMRLAGHVACMGDMRNVNKIFGVKPERKRPLGRHKRRWEDIIRIDFRENGVRRRELHESDSG